MLKCGLIGEKLGHSYSPTVHAMFGDYAYLLHELKPDDVEAFLKHGEYDGLNVTVPYKKKAFACMDVLSPSAAETGSVNTVVHLPDGRLYGDNTDVYGFTAMLKSSGLELEGKKVLVLGNGGAASAVIAALASFGTRTVVISRSGENNYTNLSKHADASVIVNCTPLGMYPKNGAAAVDLKMFPSCEGVFDLIYNPGKTALLFQAEELGIRVAVNGLKMLVAQAAKSSELFTGKAIGDDTVERVTKAVGNRLRNIVLVGMAGCGKSTVAANIGRITGRTVVDSDDEITKRFGMTPAEMIVEKGEDYFRQKEHEVIEDIGKASGLVIATGGGVVTRSENYAPLHQNGIIVWLQRPISELARDGRPLYRGTSPEELFAKREPMYRAFSDLIFRLDIDGHAEELMKLLEDRE
ncbi:MAG: shikimate kinase [Clostridia bacterium]|nr:shikimate kinase [Clostridia bacterium]